MEWTSRNASFNSSVFAESPSDNNIVSTRSSNCSSVSSRNVGRYSDISSEWLSVTIKHLVGLLRLDAGEIHFDGERIDELSETEFFPVRRRIGMVFQNATLFDSMSLIDNVALPLRKLQGLRGDALQKRAFELLERVHLQDFADTFPGPLSDGMRKRAAIARTMAMAPDVLLFDEPTTGLDPVSARRIDRLIVDLRDSENVTSIVVSHDLESIFSTADRIAFIYQGVAHMIGTPEQFRASDDPVVQQFITGKSQGPMETPGF